METLIAYTTGQPGQQEATAYTTLDDGHTWGPLEPYVPDDPAGRINFLAGVIDLTGGMLQAKVAEIFPGRTIGRPQLHGNQYYPRIWRGGAAYASRGSPVPQVHETPFLNSLVASLEQVESLFGSLSSVFRTAHPAPDNLNTYGGAIRDLIILACTEVEAQWKGVLQANGQAQTRFSTNDYVKLLPAMRLEQYEVRLIRYPEVGPIAPFLGWNQNHPTQSLSWYDVYNKVKHDREQHFKDSSLRHAIWAVAGCVVMLAAQFGEKTLRTYRFENLFQFSKTAVWEPIHWYYGPIPATGWQQVHYPL